MLWVVIHLWTARDALVLKALSLMLAKPLRLSCHCTHVKGHGGLKATVADVQRHLPQCGDGIGCCDVAIPMTERYFAGFNRSTRAFSHSKKEA